MPPGKILPGSALLHTSTESPGDGDFAATTIAKELDASLYLWTFFEQYRSKRNHHVKRKKLA